METSDPPWSPAPAAFKFFPLSKKTACRNPIEANLLFKKSIETDPQDHLHVYTDGSKDPITNEVACGLYAPQHKLKKAWRISKGSSIFTAELVAIHEAVKFINSTDAPSATIFTDSASATMAIKNRHHRPPIIYEILRELSNMKSAGSLVTIAWIPSHVGIHGNEVADDLASRAREDPLSERIPNILTPNELLSSLKTGRAEATLLKMKSTSNNWAVANHAHFGTRDWLFHRDKEVQTALVRLRSGHNGLKAFTGHWNRNEADEPDTDCEHTSCIQVRETTEHVLLKCPAYATRRAKLFNTLSRLGVEPTCTNILGLSTRIPKHKQLTIQESLITYLRDTGLNKRL